MREPGNGSFVQSPLSDWGLGRPRRRELAASGQHIDTRNPPVRAWKQAVTHHVPSGHAGHDSVPGPSPPNHLTLCSRLPQLAERSGRRRRPSTPGRSPSTTPPRRFGRRARPAGWHTAPPFPSMPGGPGGGGEPRGQKPGTWAGRRIGFTPSTQGSSVFRFLPGWSRGRLLAGCTRTACRQTGASNASSRTSFPDATAARPLTPAPTWTAVASWSRQASSSRPSIDELHSAMSSAATRRNAGVVCVGQAKNTWRGSRSCRADVPRSEMHCCPALSTAVARPSAARRPSGARSLCSWAPISASARVSTQVIRCPSSSSFLRARGKGSKGPGKPNARAGRGQTALPGHPQKPAPRCTPSPRAHAKSTIPSPRAHT